MVCQEYRILRRAWESILPSVYGCANTLLDPYILVNRSILHKPPYS